LARIRSIKPEFFDDEDLCSLPYSHRLAFIGLWVQADREGRLEDRPLRLRARIFPYDDVDMEAILADLTTAGFIIRYVVSGRAYIQVKAFLHHQIPTRDEPTSEIPGPEGETDGRGKNPNATVRARIYARDRYCCGYCDRDMTQDSRARCLDHIIPWSHGGSHHDANLVTACKPCNTKKADRTPEEAGMAWPKQGTPTPVNPPLTGGGAHADSLLTYIGNGEGEGEEEIGKRDMEVQLGAATAAREPAALPTRGLVEARERASTQGAVEPRERRAEPRALLTFPVVGTDGPEWSLTQTQLNDWRGLFPNVDVWGEARKALAWVIANPDRRKTARGMPKFLVGWFSRTADRGSPANGGHGGKTAANMANALRFAGKGEA
jgi:hypothetical protein